VDEELAVILSLFTAYHCWLSVISMRLRMAISETKV
jgi:hypothetical protein